MVNCGRHIIVAGRNIFAIHADGVSSSICHADFCRLSARVSAYSGAITVTVIPKTKLAKHRLVESVVAGNYFWWVRGISANWMRVVLMRRTACQRSADSNLRYVVVIYRTQRVLAAIQIEVCSVCPIQRGGDCERACLPAIHQKRGCRAVR